MTRDRALATRFVRFGEAALRLVAALPTDQSGRHVARQLTRAATAIGANYAEAGGAESRKDFVHKLRIADKEARESWYWLALIAARWDAHAAEAQRLAQEADELIAILTSSVRTAAGRIEE